jgi:leader peptidase (prepilin peptidase)/N-methyltransferase
MDLINAVSILVAALAGALCTIPLARVVREMPTELLREWSHDPQSIPPAQALRGRLLGLFVLGCAALPAMAAAQHGWSWETVWITVLVLTLWVLAWIDVETRLLPDRLTLGLLWAGLLVNLSEVFAPLDLAVLGAVAGYSSLFLLNTAYHRLRGREGMGAGDFKLLAAIGAWLGVGSLPAVVVIAAGSGVILGVALLLAKRRESGEAIAFGPHLCLGAAAMIYAEPWVRLWLGVFAR